MATCTALTAIELACQMDKIKVRFGKIVNLQILYRPQNIRIRLKSERYLNPSSSKENLEKGKTNCRFPCEGRTSNLLRPRRRFLKDHCVAVSGFL